MERNIPFLDGSAAERTLAVLQTVAGSSSAISLAGLSTALGLPKATLHRICQRLMDGGFLTRDVDERSFAVGPALRRLAMDSLSNQVVRGLRHGVLERLVEKVGETCNLTILDGARVLYLDRVEARWPLRLTLEVGSHVPIHCTASGKLFLAHLPADRVDSIISRAGMEVLTPFTLVDKQLLKRELEAIRARGYSTDREEFIAGLVAVAVPVADAEGVVRAALAMHAPTARVTLDEAIARLPDLERAAVEMRSVL